MVTNDEVMQKVEALQKSFNSHVLEDVEQFKAINNSLKDMRKDLRELINILNAFGTGKKILIGAAMVIGAIVGIGAGLKTIAMWFR